VEYLLLSLSVAWTAAAAGAAAGAAGLAMTVVTTVFVVYGPLYHPKLDLLRLRVWFTFTTARPC
jgi:hypothetical protein